MEEGSHNALTEEPPVDRPRRQPFPMLASTVVMQDDLLAPAVPEDDWNALQWSFSTADGPGLRMRDACSLIYPSPCF